MRAAASRISLKRHDGMLFLEFQLPTVEALLCPSARAKAETPPNAAVTRSTMGVDDFFIGRDVTKIVIARQWENYDLRNTGWTDRTIIADIPRHESDPRNKPPLDRRPPKFARYEEERAGGGDGNRAAAAQRIAARQEDAARSGGPRHGRRVARAGDPNF